MKKSSIEPKIAKTSHILGVDYGVSKIGLALADGETKIAFSYATLQNDSHFLEKLGEICRKEGVVAVVLGRLAGEKLRQRAFDIEQVGRKISQELGVEVHYQEEMFTSKMAQDNLIEKGGKNIGKQDDQEAARIILQAWLEENKS